MTDSKSVLEGSNPSVPAFMGWFPNWLRGLVVAQVNSSSNLLQPSFVGKSSNGIWYQAFNLKMGVQFSSSLLNAPMAQMKRASVFYTEESRFESWLGYFCQSDGTGRCNGLKIRWDLISWGFETPLWYFSWDDVIGRHDRFRIYW